MPQPRDRRSMWRIPFKTTFGSTSLRAPREHSRCFPPLHSPCRAAGLPYLARPSHEDRSPLASHLVLIGGLAVGRDRDGGALVVAREGGRVPIPHPLCLPRFGRPAIAMSDC